MISGAAAGSWACDGNHLNALACAWFGSTLLCRTAARINMTTSLLRALLVCVVLIVSVAAQADDEPLCNYCLTIDASGNFDGNGCPTNFPMRPGSECYCLASLNGNAYGIDGYACRKPALPPSPPPRKFDIRKTNWERLSDELIKRAFERPRVSVSDNCTACYYTLGGLEKNCETGGGSPGDVCACYEELPGKLFPLRVQGKLCQAADGSPR